MGLDIVSDITVERLVKKKTPSKNYVFCIRVEWKKEIIITIYRSYSTILALQQNLLKLEEFLTYLKNEYAERRTGYLLQGKTLFGKLGIKTRRKALIKLKEVDEFLKSIIHLPSGIAQCDAVVEFFRPVPEDMMSNEANDYNMHSVKESKGTRQMGYRFSVNAPNISEPILLDQYVAISDYTKIQENGLSLKAGNIVEVITKGEHGWWFVDLDGDLGWVPASFLIPRDSEDDIDDQVLEVFHEGEEEICFAMDAYEPADEDELTLEVGKILQIKQKNIDGWWLVSCDGMTGWAPCMYLRVLSTYRGYTRKMERETAMLNMQSIFAIPDRRTTWNPVQPTRKVSATSRRLTIKRRYDKIAEVTEDKPSYMNIDFDKNNNKSSQDEADSDYEEIPSYINVDYGKNKDKKAGKRSHSNKDRSDSGKEAAPSFSNAIYGETNNKKAGKGFHGNNDVPQGPSYMNMNFHQKNAQRMRRTKDNDEDFVEIDFSKMKTSDQEETKSDDKVENEEQEEKPEPDTVHVQENLTSVQRKKQVNLPNLVIVDDEPVDDDKPSHIEDNKAMNPSDSYNNGVEVFLSIGDYTKDAETEVNLEEGKSVEVLEQTDGGWWLVRTQSLSTGWAPSNFLEKIEPKEFERRKALGLEPPERPPLRPPKSPYVHKKADQICSERKFWSFVSKNGNDATCSIVKDENNNSDDKEASQAGEESVGERNDKWICDPETGVCNLERLDTKL